MSGTIDGSDSKSQESDGFELHDGREDFGKNEGKISTRLEKDVKRKRIEVAQQLGAHGLRSQIFITTLASHWKVFRAA